MRRLFRTLAPAALLAFGAACTSNAEPLKRDEAPEKAQEASRSDFLERAKHPEPNVWVSGQPSLDDLKAAKAAGVKVVANLRSEREPTGFQSEEETVEALGMRYHAIPVAGAAGVNLDNAHALKALLEQTKGDKVLLHCASGNRIGALFALLAHEEGKSVEEALEAGRQAGLRGLEPVVRSKLEARAE